jgi:light-regulated signal transduction histidine kinase (bacteriophytochrome)
LIPDLDVHGQPAESLADAHAEIARLTGELERSNERLTQIIHAASHDFAEPLQIVLSYAELLDSRYAGRLDETGERFLAGIETGAKRIRALVDGLSAYSQLTRPPAEPEQVDCAEIVDEALEALADQIDATGAAVSVDPLPTVLAEARQLRSLFGNLLDNAIKFRRAHEAPEIRVWAERHPGEWLFSIRDNGIGLDFVERERVFEMFQRLHTPEQYPGVGVGLAVCKQIVERLGGRIWVDSTAGHGSTFRFTIPLRGTSELPVFAAKRKPE